MLVALPLLLSSGCIAINLEWVAPEESSSEASASESSSDSASSGASGTAAGTAGSTAAGTAADTGQGSEGSVSGASGTSGTSTAGATSLDPSEDTGCVPFAQELEVLPPDIVFVVDKSVMMADGYFPASEDPMEDQIVPEWTAVRAGVLAKVNELGAWAHMGMVLAPEAGAADMGASACVVQLELDAELMMNAYDNFNSKLPVALFELGGGRPLGQALGTAKEALLASPGNGMQFIVVITSGAPNCDTSNGDDPQALFETYDDEAKLQILDAYQQDIFSMIVGLSVEQDDPPEPEDMEPDIDAWEILHELALEGGMANADDYPAFKQANSAAGLYKELGIVDELPFCVTRLPPELQDYSITEFDLFVEVEFEDEPLTRFDKCEDNETGFMLPNGNAEGVIVACGTTCAEMRQANSNGDPADDEHMTLYTECP